jgi:transposase
MVELVRAGRTPNELALEFEPTAESIRNWVKQAEIDEGQRLDGLTTDEKQELARLRRENKHLPLPKAVLAYRNEYLVERGFARLKGRTLSLTPMYLKDDDRVTGLIRLLSIGLRVLTLLEFVVQRRLAESQEKLAGLYAGNPKRTTVTPRAETLLEAFKSIYLNTVTIGGQIHLHITPLSDLQLKILSLLGFSPDIYSRLTANSQKPP